MNTEFNILTGSQTFQYTLVGLIGLVFFFFGVNFTQDENWVPLLTSLVLLGILVPSALRVPHTIVLDELGNMTFKSLLFEKVYSVKLLQSISKRYPDPLHGSEPDFFIIRYVDFQFDNGKVTIRNDVDNLSELIVKIKSINQNVVTTIC